MGGGTRNPLTRMELRKRLFAYAALIAWLAAGGALHATAATLSGTPGSGLGVRAEVRLGTLYNSNLLQYSSRDQSAFLHHDPASRFGIRSLDDAAFRGSGTIALTRRLRGPRATGFTYTYTRTSWSQNPVKDSGNHRITLHQPWGGSGWTDLAYAVTPSRYLRHLWDVDFRGPYTSYPHYQPAYFSSREIRVEAGWRPASRWALSTEFAAGRLDYNASFQERDADTWEVAFAAAFGRGGGPGFSISPSLAFRNARGTDPAHQEIPDDQRADISARDIALTLGGTLPERALAWFPLEVRAQVQVEHRTFTTDRLGDLSHHNRKDTSWSASLGLEREIMRGVSWYATSRLESQTSNGAAAGSGLEEVAAFHQVTAGGGLHFAWSGEIP